MARELLLASTDLAEADEQRRWMSDRSARLLRRRTLAHLGWVLSVYRLGPELPAAALMAELTAQWPAALPEANQRYTALANSTAGRRGEYARALVAWPTSCDAAPRIAMLDGAVDLSIAALQGRRIIVQAIAPADSSPDFEHGNALASLLLGQDSQGLLPDAELLIGVVMARGREGPFTTTERVLLGLDWVLGLKPAASVLNLSFGGPRSAQLDRALTRLTREMPVAAAAGNEGRREVVWPAAHDGVIAVTAVDARGRRWSRANSGEPVAIAAPGVEVWIAGSQGEGRYLSGTSIATVFVSAALAVTPKQPLAQWLTSHSREAGAPGRDPDYGHGLLHVGGRCVKVKS